MLSRPIPVAIIPRKLTFMSAARGPNPKEKSNSGLGSPSVPLSTLLLHTPTSAFDDMTAQLLAPSIIVVSVARSHVHHI